MTLNRIATKLKLVLTDAIPEGSATINVKPSGAITPVTYLYQYAPSGSSSWTKIASSSIQAVLSNRVRLRLIT